MYKIGIIGDRATVSGFIALGYATFEAEDADTARKILQSIADDSEGEYAIIFITERYAEALGEVIKKYSGRMTPAITVLPDGAGDKGRLSYGMSLIKRNVERAVGADILFRD